MVDCGFSPLPPDYIAAQKELHGVFPEADIFIRDDWGNNFQIRMKNQTAEEIHYFRNISYGEAVTLFINMEYTR